MKFLKKTFLYVICPAFLLGAGFSGGVLSMDFFYPGAFGVSGEKQEAVEEKSVFYAPSKSGEAAQAGTQTGEEAEEAGNVQTGEDAEDTEEAEKEAEAVEAGKAAEALGRPFQEVNGGEQTLSVDTRYVLEETDIVNDTAVEITQRLPDEYVGMNREQFLAAMESYAAFPPLAEMERGFVGLEVRSFSREKVVVQMNYQYLQPSESFYLAVRDNEVVVYLEDRETIFINTGIQLKTLPQDVQTDIIRMLWVEDEESLYHFLETYSS